MRTLDHRVKQSAAYRHLMTPSLAILLITSHAIFNLKDVTSQCLISFTAAILANACRMRENLYTSQ